MCTPVKCQWSLLPIEVISFFSPLQGCMKHILTLYYQQCALNWIIILSSQTLESLSSFVPSLICNKLGSVPGLLGILEIAVVAEHGGSCPQYQHREARGLGVQGQPELQTEIMFKNRQAGRQTHTEASFSFLRRFWDCINKNPTTRCGLLTLDQNCWIILHSFNSNTIPGHLSKTKPRPVL